MQTEPEDLPPAAKNLACLCHASALCGCFLPFLGHLLPPLLVWHLTRNRSPFIDEHGKEALNFQIALLTYALLPCAPLFLHPSTSFFIPFLLSLHYVASTLGALLASTAARRGRPFFFPGIFRLLR